MSSDILHTLPAEPARGPIHLFCKLLPSSLFFIKVQTHRKVKARYIYPPCAFKIVNVLAVFTFSLLIFLAILFESKLQIL